MFILKMEILFGRHKLKINELSEEIIKYIKNQHGISIRKIATNNGHTMNWTFQ